MAVWWILSVALAQAQDTDALRVETYNVGLARGFVDNAIARAPAIAADLAVDPPDILCLQEAWNPEDREQLVAAVADTYPHSLMLPVTQHYADAAPACRRKELFGEDRFASCMSSSCDGLDGDALTACVVSKCGPILRDLSSSNPQCANAVMAQVGKPALKAIWTVMRPMRKANMFAYDGSDGLILLSRYPLSDTGELDFTDIATLNRRRALHADVSFQDTDVRVYCTHLTANLDDTAPYPGAFGGWAEENLAQVDRLLEHAGSHDGPVAILGDLNTGPAVPSAGLVAEMSDSHDRIVAAGYDDPALLLETCTYCADNSMIDDDVGPRLIDHAYLRGIDARDGTRTRDQSVTLDGGLTTHLSDHFGYAVSLYFAPPPPPEPEPEPEPEPTPEPTP